MPEKLLVPAPHKLGAYSAIRNDHCVYLELKAASDDGHIDTKKGIYFADFSFWHANRDAYANVGYNAEGFTGVFGQIKDFVPGIVAVLARNLSDISKDLARSSIDACIADLEKQTELLGTITELPPTPMCR